MGDVKSGLGAFAQKAGHAMADGTKSMATRAGDGVKKAADDKMASMEADAALARSFRRTASYGPVSVDEEHGLVRLADASRKLPRQGKRGMTAELVGHTLGSRVLRASDVTGCELVTQDGEAIGGTGGSAVVGALVGGWAGAAIGASVGSRSVSKWVDLLALRVDTTDPSSPCWYVPFTTQRIDTSSREYAKVLSRAQSASAAIRAMASRG